MKKVEHIIQNLSPSDALAILNILVKEDEQVASRIAEIASMYLAEVDLEDVAFSIQDEMNFLEVEEVWDRAGNTRHGYVDVADAVDQIIGEILEPYLQELKKYHQLEMSREAMLMCKGLLKGLYLFERESTSEFKDWAADAPIVFAEEVVMEWKSGHPSSDDISAMKGFISDELGCWGAGLL